MTELKLVKGNLFDHIPEIPFVLCHVANDIGIFGSGFVIPLKQKWPIVEQEYVEAIRKKSIQLGDAQFVEVRHEPIGLVANMVAQRGIMDKGNLKPIKYRALADCMEQVAYETFKKKAEIIAPKFGSLRAGGNWDFILELIEEIWLAKDIPVTIFDINL